MGRARSAETAIGGRVRTRWAAIGAAVAVALGAGGLLSASAAVDSGERATFVPIAPCRVLDTRPAPDTVGTRTSPLGPGETYSIAVTGSVGRCTIPADASAVVLNVAIVSPTASSFLTVFPAGGAVPLAANLNFVAGQAPVSNAATVDVGSGGQISFYNLAGQVHVTADISGYYVDHTHDDRYSRLDHAHDDTYQRRVQRLTFDGTGLTFLGAAQGAISNGCFANFNASAPFVDGYLSLPVPAGTVLHAAEVVMFDSSGATTYTGSLVARRVQENGLDTDRLGTFNGGALSIDAVPHAIALAEPFVVDDRVTLAVEVSLGLGQFGNGICQVGLDVTLP